MQRSSKAAPQSVTAMSDREFIMAPTQKAQKLNVSFTDMDIAHKIQKGNNYKRKQTKTK